MNDEWPECEEFYNLMQAYRHTPLVCDREVLENYKAVKAWLRREREKAAESMRDLLWESVHGISVTHILSKEEAMREWRAKQ